MFPVLKKPIVAQLGFFKESWTQIKVLTPAILNFVRRLIWIIAAGFTGVSGIRILSEPSCESVSFGRAGGRRMSAATCFSDSSGALPANLVGLGLIVLALIGLAVALRRPRLTNDLAGMRDLTSSLRSESFSQPPKGSENATPRSQSNPEACHACGVARREGSVYCPACGEKLAT